jgi:hypothetical protein
MPRQIDIRLLPQGIILPINPNLVANFTFTPPSPQVGQTVAFDAATSTNNGTACLTLCTYEWTSATARRASADDHAPVPQLEHFPGQTDRHRPARRGRIEDNRGDRCGADAADRHVHGVADARAQQRHVFFNARRCSGADERSRPTPGISATALLAPA